MVFMFFFFKQKTAYEMRISDWSSDVCSSDLDMLAVDPDLRHAGAAAGLLAHFLALGSVIGDIDLGIGLAFPVEQCLGARAVATQDRKSVVEGKSVSVRVDLGGRCIIKKNKN